MSDLERMKELVEQLDAAARAYYQESKELMSNKEYDELYDELAALEKKTGTVAGCCHGRHQRNVLSRTLYFPGRSQAEKPEDHTGSAKISYRQQ